MLKKPPEIGGLTHKIRKIVFSYFRCPVFAFSVSRFNGVITLSAQPMGEKAILQVTDSGCGIPDFALPRIFDRFYSLPRENGRKSSGLGLAFVSEAARLLNGEVTLCNRPEGGVLASLTLHRHFT